MLSIKNLLLYTLLFLLPKNCLSRLMGCLANLRLPKALMVLVNQAFAKRYSINLSEAEKPLEDYQSLQEFFSRRLRPNARVIDGFAHSVISPCDGVLSVQAKLTEGSLIQAKGRYYSLEDLVVKRHVTELFRYGHYATIYLSPRDYHRFHIPMDGVLEETIYIPGSLWPVNHWAVNNVKNLFCRNERVISIIRCPRSNFRLAHLAIGATLVGKIELQYCDLKPFNLHQGRHVRVLKHEPIAVRLGDELGKFLFGSTVVLLWQKDMVARFHKESMSPVKMGEILTTLQ